MATGKGKSPTITGKITLEYLKRFPKASALTLAKKMYTENPEAFKSVEYARLRVRYYLGQSGIVNRKNLAIRDFQRTARDTNPYGFPEMEPDTWVPVHLPSIYDKGLIIEDLHYPYTDLQALNAMMDYVIGHNNINFIFINGDGIDCYQGSKFIRDPRKRSLDSEIWGWVEFLNVLQHTFPGVKIFWKLGNHEERIENYLKVKAPELLDMDEFKLGNIIKIRGVEGVDVIEKQIVYMGRLPFVHGHEFSNKASNPVNAARGLFLKTLSSSATSHHHQSSYHSETDINGKLMSWWSMGCLCLLHPEYALLNKWNHGFATIEIDGLDFLLDNMKIYKGNVYR